MNQQPISSPPPQEGYVAPVQPTMVPQSGAPAIVNPNWENDLWSCFSPTETCCMGYWCPCILHGQTHQKLKDPSAEVSAVNGPCLAFCGLLYCGGLGFVLAMMDRMEIREKFGIAGSGGSDFLYSFCCACCVIIQNAKEVEQRNAQAAGGYQTPNEKMQAP